MWQSRFDDLNATDGTVWKKFVTKDVRNGWHSAAQSTKRSSETCIAAHPVFSFQCSRPFGTLFRSVASKVSSCNNEELTTVFVLQMDQIGPECYTDPTYFQPCGKCTLAPTNVEIAAGKVCSWFLNSRVWQSETIRNSAVWILTYFLTFQTSIVLYTYRHDQNGWVCPNWGTGSTMDVVSS